MGLTAVGKQRRNSQVDSGEKLRWWVFCIPPKLHHLPPDYVPKGKDVAGVGSAPRLPNLLCR